MELTTKAKSAFIKVAEWLEAGAPHVTIDNKRRVDVFDMGDALSHYNSCGTVCCIAGAIYQFEKLEGHQDHNTTFYDPNCVGGIVNKFLGLSIEETEPLFIPWGHIDGREEFFSEPKIAAKVIRDFVETGVVSWPEDPEY